jgi:hypothetical protein
MSLPSLPLTTSALPLPLRLLSAVIGPAELLGREKLVRLLDTATTTTSAARMITAVLHRAQRHYKTDQQINGAPVQLQQAVDLMQTDDWPRRGQGCVHH